MDAQNNTIKVRDLRRVNFFTVDNLFLDRYSAILGTIASMIYIYLCRCADKDQTAFPGQEDIANKLGTTRATVSRKLEILKKLNIISYISTKNADTGEQLNNTYTLLDRSEWLPCVVGTHGSDVSSEHTAEAEVRVSSEHTINTNKTKTNIKNFGKEDLKDSPSYRVNVLARNSRPRGPGPNYSGTPRNFGKFPKKDKTPIYAEGVR
jgi:hypothetical protein